eukprot:TRINITY_DN96191_c0_g1_i1.p1 TRINITY_DN96191_c0_g1~~TRINITY_DN96191_c0_g1_i1.p1  ORF type:complete len:403 (-),score=57.93 TRINITY_DN96191_c0_g1_i1:70-1245(-)
MGRLQNYFMEALRWIVAFVVYATFSIYFLKPEPAVAPACPQPVCHCKCAAPVLARAEVVSNDPPPPVAQTKCPEPPEFPVTSNAPQNCKFPLPYRPDCPAPTQSHSTGQAQQLKPKYHLSALLSAHGLTCQDHKRFLRGYVDPVVVECGTSGGNEAAELSHHARVYAFEANPANVAHINDVLKKEAVPGKVNFRHAACGNVSGTIDLYIPHGNTGSQVASLASQAWWSGSTRKVTVPIVRLSDVIHEHVTMLKIDVQGAEPDVIDGAIDLIRNYGVDVIHMEWQPYLQVKNNRDPVAFLKMVYDLGYHCFECRYLRKVQSPNRDFWNFTYNNFITPFEPKFLNGIVGGLTDIVCQSFSEAPRDNWRQKSLWYNVTEANTYSLPQPKEKNPK